MITVLIADDSLPIRLSMSNYLKQQGSYEVIALAEDGQQAVEYYIDHQPQLCLLDISMPRKDGIEALKDILIHDKNANVVMVSAQTQKNTIVDCLNLGAKGFIEKPIKLKDPVYLREFEETLKDALG